MEKQTTRRKMIAQSVMLCGGWVVAAKSAWAGDSHAEAMGGVPIHQEEDFNVAPERVYAALLSSSQFQEITGAAAEIEPVAGGAFTLFDKHIIGRHLELMPNQRVVQAWREPGWSTGDYSIVRFQLTPRANGTRLVFDHWGFPEPGRAHLVIGWKEHYWEPMRKYFAGRGRLVR
jgi:activator of HSP90 ATPase